MFGLEENKIVCLDQLGEILICSINYDLKKITRKRRNKVELKRDLARFKFESLVSVSASGQGKYLVVRKRVKKSFDKSTLMLFEVKGCSLVQLATLQQKGHPGWRKRTFGFWRWVGKHALWVALEDSLGGDVQLYDFDTDSGRLRELVNQRVSHQEKKPSILQVSGDKLFYTGNLGFVIALSLKQS